MTERGTKSAMDKKILVIIFILVALALITLWVRGAFSAPTLSGVKVRIGGYEYAVDVADTIPAKAQGLSGRAGLASGEGMLFVFDSPQMQTFWMHGMLFPIDIVWILDDTVVGVTENAPIPTSQFETPTFSSPSPINRVLEVAAGTALKNGIVVGSKVEILGYGK